MKIKDDILNAFKSNLDYNTQRICTSLVDYIFREKERIDHLSFGEMIRIVGDQYSEVDLLKSIQFLRGYKTPILEVRYELIDENDEVYPITNSEIEEAKKSGKLIHPDTGYPVENYEEKVFMYFVPGEDFLRNIA